MPFRVAPTPLSHHHTHTTLLHISAHASQECTHTHTHHKHVTAIDTRTKKLAGIAIGFDWVDADVLNKKEELGPFEPIEGA